MTKTALRAAGFPACAWPYAAPYVCFQENTFWADGHECPSAKTHKKGEFTGLKIPSRARVFLKPSGARPDDKPTKWAPDSLEGVFAGYFVQPGYTWSRRCLAWPLTILMG